MNTLTVIRTFAHPGYTPARRVRICSSSWYRVTMQAVEHGPGDYMGLGEGTYTEILPGQKARERRDAHLNHCNAIEEYTGPIFELLCNRYGGAIQHVGYFASKGDVEKKLDERKAEHDKWISDLLVEAAMYENVD